MFFFIECFVISDFPTKKCFFLKRSLTIELTGSSLTVFKKGLFSKTLVFKNDIFFKKRSIFKLIVSFSVFSSSFSKRSDHFSKKWNDPSLYLGNGNWHNNRKYQIKTHIYFIVKNGMGFSFYISKMDYFPGRKILMHLLFKGTVKDKKGYRLKLKHFRSWSRGIKCPF